jgi:hypothetical protein
VEYHLRGFGYLLEKYKPYTVMLESRPAFTATTASSVEDPSNTSCVSGLGNQLLWGAGGRPYEQASTYTSALFYYSCEHSVISIPYAWAAGDSASQELLKQCQATAGQMYQGADGVIRYKQPFSFADGSAATFTFDITATAHSIPFGETPHANITEEYPDSQLATKITCSHIPREKQDYQPVIEDTTHRIIGASATLAIDLEPKYPLRNTPILVPNDGINVIFMTGKKASVDGTTGYTYTVASYAQKVTVTFVNHTTTPMYVTKISLNGQPVVAGEAQVVSVGSGDEELQISDNPNIQTANQALRLCTIAALFYSQERAVVTVHDAPWMVQRSQGEVINLNVPSSDYTDEPCVITAIHDTQTGSVADYALVPIQGLPRTSDFFQWGSTNYSGLSRKIGY